MRGGKCSQDVGGACKDETYSLTDVSRPPLNPWVASEKHVESTAARWSNFAFCSFVEMSKKRTVCMREWSECTHNTRLAPQAICLSVHPAEYDSEYAARPRMQTVFCRMSTVLPLLPARAATEMYKENNPPCPMMLQVDARDLWARSGRQTRCRRAATRVRNLAQISSDGDGSVRADDEPAMGARTRCVRERQNRIVEESGHTNWFSAAGFEFGAGAVRRAARHNPGRVGPSAPLALFARACLY